MSVTRVQRGGAGGGELVVEHHGRGLAVLFLHGFPFDRTMWRHPVAALASVRRVAVDHRGAGESRAATGVPFATYADDAAAILDALEIPAAVVCGLSMGGYVALDFVRRHRRRVRALVLADTRADADSAAARRARDESIALVEQQGPEPLAERMLQRVLAPRTLAERPDVVETVRAMMAGWTGEAMVGALRAMKERPDSTALLPSIEVPTLVLVGEHDAVSPPAEARRMADAIPGARLVEIPDAGHLAPLEQPLVAARALAEFLEKLS